MNVRRVLDLMSTIEDLTGKMFHESHPILEAEIMTKIDSEEGLLFYINKLSKEIDKLNIRGNKND